MKFAGPISRSVKMALALAFLGSASARSQTVTITTPNPAPKKNHASSTVTLAPEVQKKLDAFLDKIKADRGDYWQTKLNQEVDVITKATSLADQGHRALQSASKQAVADSMKAWTPKIPDEILQQFASVPKEQLLAQLDQAMAMLGQAPMDQQTQFCGDMSAPDQQASWKTALQQVLTPAQFDAWTQKQSAQKNEAEKQIVDILKNGADRTQAEETNETMAECKGIETSLKLPADRAAKLEALGKSAVTQTVELYRKQEEAALLAMSEDQRRPLPRNGFYMSPQPDSLPTALPVWKDGLAQILTSQEQAQLQAAKDTSKTRREHVMAQVMVMLLDEKLALTEAQRQKLEPIADRLVKDVAQLYPQGGPGNYAFISNDVFYTAATNATDAELKPILDPVQLKRWHDLSGAESSTEAPDATTVNALASNDGQPEAVEKAISSFFYEKTENERKRELEANTLKAEDVARVLGLKADSAERLQATACGATEQTLMTWKWFTEQQIRSQLQGLTPQNVNQRLQSLQDLFFQRQFPTSNRQDIWEETLQTELTPDQQDAWKKETDAREHYRETATAAAVMAEFDRQTHLTDEQWNKLDPLIAGVLNDYSQGIAQVFSGMNGMAWYLGGPYVLIPLMGVDDHDLKSILTKDQMDLWTGSQQFANATNFWQMIKQTRGPQHIRRTARTVIED